jgi:hypothetical protein
MDVPHPCGSSCYGRPPLLVVKVGRPYHLGSLGVPSGVLRGDHEQRLEDQKGKERQHPAGWGPTQGQTRRYDLHEFGFSLVG